MSCESESGKCDGKQRWPELLGANPDDAKATIEKENPNVKVKILPPGLYPTSDFCCNRVWLWVTGYPNGTVSQVPIVG